MEDYTPNPEEVDHLLANVKRLEDELEKARQALAMACFAKIPLPYTEEEILRMCEEEQGLTLEEFWDDLKKAAG